MKPIIVIRRQNIIEFTNIIEAMEWVSEFGGTIYRREDWYQEKCKQVEMLVKGEKMDRKNWQVYKEGKYWYWDAWDDVNKQWWVSDPFENYDDACAACDSMMSDAYQDDIEN